MTYPDVLGERETLHAVCAGRSLARYGDGEFALCAGRDLKCQRHEARLGTRLREILHDSGECLVGIPNLWVEGPKAAYWQKRAGDVRFLVERPYVSAFITRGDSAPWINTRAYWAMLETLWIDHDVTLVRGADSERGLKASDLTGARSVREILCPRVHAFTKYDEILQRIGTPERVLLCLGPTATVLAVDLCAKGVHAIDLGHVAFFLRKHRHGEPMTMTLEDKALV